MNVFSVFTIALVAFAAVVSATEYHAGNFAQYVTDHGKKYATEEERDYRYTVYLNTLADIEARNADPASTAVFGINKFSDLTPKEFASQFLNAKGGRPFMHDSNGENVMKGLNIQRNIVHADNNTIDWYALGATTAVKDQEQCGSCWAFSATEETESMWFMAGNALPTLAPQQIVSCDTKGQDQGCNGGFTEGAYDYIQSTGGLMSEASYPYTGRDGQCKFDASSVVATVSGYTYAVPKATYFTAKDACTGGNGMEAALQTAPVSVCVYAEPWQSYRSGIMTEDQCSSSTLMQDHCVQLTGYTKGQSGGDYWVVRNSWNTDWGNGGYIYLSMTGNTCGLCDDATIVTN
jgi:hypothetical protein